MVARLQQDIVNASESNPRMNAIIFPHFCDISNYCFRNQNWSGLSIGAMGLVPCVTFLFAKFTTFVFLNFCPQATTDLKYFSLPMFQTCQSQPNTRLKISLLLVGTTAMQLCWTLEILVRSGSLKSVSGLRMKRRWQPRLLLPRSLSSTTCSCPPWSLWRPLLRSCYPAQEIFTL